MTWGSLVGGGNPSTGFKRRGTKGFNRGLGSAPPPPDIGSCDECLDAVDRKDLRGRLCKPGRREARR